MIIALLGNPNSGKTTLFNQLTGSNQHVGNFPGVTVEKKEGAIRGQKNMTLVDLPGIYSLSPYTAEEVVTRDFLLVNKPEAVINIVDATNIERNLYLTLQLMEVGVPVVVALNMMDEVRQNGDSIDVPLLSQNLGLPIVPISAAKNEGCEELVQRTIEAAQQKDRPRGLDLCQGEVHRAVHSIAHIIEKEVKDAGLPSRYAATKVVEGDPITLSKLNLTDSEKEIIDNIVREMETNLGTDREAALADMRYDFIANACRDAVKKNGNARELQRSIQIDRVLTHKYFGIPIFLCVMLLTFFLTFNVIGAVLSDWLSLGIDGLTGLLDQALANLGINAAVHSLLIDGVCVGVGSVLSFLPTIVTLFFFLSILEDSGYMARVAFVMDKLLRKIGLSGRSFVPMLIGFGCSVPAIMATRTLASERDRRMTILLTPFMSCSAKLPIYATFTAAFFPNAAPLVMIGLYVGGMVVGVLYGGIAGYFGGAVDNIMMRIVDTISSIPMMLYVILIMVVLGSGLHSIILAMGLTYWVGMVRIVRSQVLTMREQEFVSAAVLLGVPTRKILVRHLIPNAMGPIMVALTMQIPSAMFTEAFLSFIGLGVSKPQASWGALANAALPSLYTSPYQLFYPALIMSITILALNLFSDGLRDSLDPRLRK